MSGSLRSTWRLLVREVSAFGVVGMVCFLIDIGLFQLFYGGLRTGAVTAKVLSTLIAMTVAYFGHRHWSFSRRARTGMRREYLRFTLINGGTLLLGMAVVAFVRYPLGQDGSLVLQAANVTSIAISTVLRYLAYRTWVFPAHQAAAGRDPVSPDEAAQARIVA